MTDENTKKRPIPRDLSCIKISLARIEQKIESHFEQEKEHREYEKEHRIKCDAERNILLEKIGKVGVRVGHLETKQKLVTWIGGTVAVTWIGVIAKWISNHTGKG